MRMLLAFIAVLALGLSGQARAIEIQEGVSPGGIPFWLVEEHSIPIVAIEISIPGGSRLDPEGKAGASRLMSALFDEGAGDMDSAAFSARADELSARFGFSAGNDYFYVSAFMLSETLEDSMALLATALSAPRLDAEAVERMRAGLLSEISDNAKDPNSIASRTWNARTYPGHPYGIVSTGTVESVTALTIEDLRDAHGRLIQKNGILIAVVGDVTLEEAGAMVDLLLADIPEGVPHEFERLEADPPAGIEVVEFDVPQSVAIFGHRGIYRDDPDFIPAFVMNHILGGGGFSARLMTEVREKRGLAYGVYSYLSSQASAAMVLGSVQTANERMAESIQVIRAEWARIAEEGVSEEELERAKKYLTGAYPLRFDTNAKIARTMIAMMEDDLGTSYIAERNGLIEAVTIDDIKRVAARLMRSDALSIVIVGKPEGL